MSEPTVCRHCGYFISYVLPKAPGIAGWVHMPYTSTKPAGPPCDHAEPPTTLAEFLLARIAEDEASAQLAASDGGWPDFQPGGHWVTLEAPEAPTPDDQGRYWPTQVLGNGLVVAGGHGSEDDGVSGHHAQHIARWDPARVLAECEVKRLLIERVGNPDWAGFRILALPYADHEDYRAEWRP